MDYTYDLRTDTFVPVVLDVGKYRPLAPGGCWTSGPAAEPRGWIQPEARPIEHASEHGYPFLMPNGESPCDGC